MTKEDDTNPEQRIRAAIHALADARQRPCISLVGVAIDRSLLRPLRGSIAEKGGGAIDVVLCSHGGSGEAAYLVARELKRRFAKVTVYVPLCAKSAATLICLAADELVLGDLGELGPLDPHSDEMRAKDRPSTMSALVGAQAMKEINDQAMVLFDMTLERLTGSAGLRPWDAAERAARMAARTLAPLYEGIDLVRLAEQARGLENATAYAVRVLRRFHPEIPPDVAQRLAAAFVSGYPSHGFVIDREEMAEIGMPFRLPDAIEAPLLDAITDALLECDERVEVEEWFDPAPAARGENPELPARGESPEEDAPGDRGGVSGPPLPAPAEEELARAAVA